MKLSTFLLLALLVAASCTSVEIVTPIEYDDQGFPLKWEPVETLKEDD